MKSNEKHKTISRINFICINEWHVGIIYFFVFFSLLSNNFFKNLSLSVCRFQKNKNKKWECGKSTRDILYKIRGRGNSSLISIFKRCRCRPYTHLTRTRLSSNFSFYFFTFFINIIRMFFKLTSAKWIFLSNILTPAQIESYSE